MKLEITRKIEHTETIDIEFPYYYKNDLMPDDSSSIIYGKIEEMRHTSICIRHHDLRNEDSYEIEIKEEHASNFSCYMVEKYKICESEYLAAKKTALAAIASA